MVEKMKTNLGQMKTMRADFGQNEDKKLPGRGAFDNVPKIDCHRP